MDEEIEDSQKVAHLMWKVAHGVTKGTKEWDMEQAIRAEESAI